MIYSTRNCFVFFILFCGLLPIVNAQQIPAPAQNKSILIKGATLHLGNGKKIENGVIGFRNGKITLVAEPNTPVAEADYEVKVEAAGKHVYPGFIAPNNILGLQEIEAVRSTNDFAETGEINPNVRTAIAYNTDSKIIPTVRTNGVLLTQCTPRWGLIAGSSSVMQLDAWNWEDALIKEDDGIHINWPRIYLPGRWGQNGPADFDKNKNYDKAHAALIAFFEEAKSYCESTDKQEANLRFEALRGVFNGKQNLYIRANEVKEITEAIRFVKKFSIAHPVLIGAKRAYLVADEIKNNKIPVMLGRTHDLPEQPDDDINLPFMLPKMLFDAGIFFCLHNEGDMEATHTRNLPFLAGTAVAFGLPYEEAVAAISGNTARILGISNKVGTLEIGKEATLFISSGDALDMRSNNVESAFIGGRKIDLGNFQQDLYQKYKKKYSLD